ncbi:primosomal protein N' [bacterium]|nr:primosomal protein N' [bacterium]
MTAAHQASLFSEDELPDNLTPWEIADQQDRLLAEVVLDRPLSTVFHYVVPEGLRELIAPGQRVEVPFGAGNQALIGYCVGTTRQSPTKRQLKSLTAILDREPLIDSALLKLTQWIAEHYLCSWGQVLQSVIPAGVKSKAGTRELIHYRVSPQLKSQWPDIKLPAKQRAIVAALIGATQPLTVEQLTEQAGCGIGPIHTLRDRGWIVAEQHRVWTTREDESIPEPHQELHLTHEQQAAVNVILEALRAPRHETQLLFGVTGSGKTEVYIRAIEEVVSFGRQAIVLVPEISLTPQTIRRFRSRFSSVAVLHSHLTDAERHQQWRRIAEGHVQVVVGARSAVFAPTPHLGLIVIDEEHESSFKQDSTPRYHAREVARQRAQMHGIPLLLGTATPTLESWVRVQQKQDRLLALPRRVARRPLPPVTIIDVRDDPLIQQQRALGRALLTAMNATLKTGGQIILFLNVRGFAPLILCRGCGNALRCPECELTLTWHQQHQCALCHTCGYECDIPAACPKCQRPGVRYVGMGTERLEQELRTLLPKVSCLRMDSDTMQARGSHATALEKFRHGEAQILLGTQMIAKGLDFPNVTLVGVVDADTSLRQPDLRARERTFQLIAQVAGRTGRGPKGGRVLVQTSCPDDPAIQFAAKHDFVGFANHELQERELCDAPPYTTAVRVILRGPSEPAVEASGHKLVEQLRQAAPALDSSIQIAGPAPCPLFRLQGNFRFHIQLLAKSLPPLQLLWRQVEPGFRPEKDVEYVVDVEPLSYR